MSEIDDIFASKGQNRVPKTQPSASSSSASQTSKKKKTINKASEAISVADNTKSGEASKLGSRKRPPPETVVDSSSQTTHTKRFKADKAIKANPKAKATQISKDSEDEVKFKDSRGIGSRRTTEEGWLIYKEDELGIRGDGGGTPLCPFDCDCCF